MLFVPLHLAVLALLMYLFAKHEADISVPKICMVFIPTIWILNVASNFTGPIILILYFLLPFLFLKQWFYVGSGKAAAIAGTFTGYMIVFSIAFYLIMIVPSKELLADDGEKETVELIEPDYEEVAIGDFITTKGHYRLTEDYVLHMEESGSTSTQYKIKKNYTSNPLMSSRLTNAAQWFIYKQSESYAWLYSGKDINFDLTTHRLGKIQRLALNEEKIGIANANQDMQLTTSIPRAVITRLEKEWLKMEALNREASTSHEANNPSTQNPPPIFDLIIRHKGIKPGEAITKPGNYHVDYKLAIVVATNSKNVLQYYLKTKLKGPKKPLGSLMFATSWMIVPDSSTSCWIYSSHRNGSVVNLEHVTLKGTTTHVARLKNNPTLLEKAPDIIKERIKTDKKKSSRR